MKTPATKGCCYKRPLDLLVLLILLPALVVFFMVVSILIKMVSRGPVFYIQERIGHKGKKFRLLKFRTMHVHAEPHAHVAHVAQLYSSNQPMKKLDASGDNRLIPFGRALRASGLDELPQLINVLRGEMSIVGPRPCTTYEYSLYEKCHKTRCDVLPGLTGLWQVSGKNRTTFKEMIELDLEYVNIASLRLDLKIIALTFPTLIGQFGEHVIALPPKRQEAATPQ